MSFFKECFEIDVGFDGACPFSRDGILHHENKDYEIRPSWRSAAGIGEEAPGCGFRFSIKIRNTSDTAQFFCAFINWEDINPISLNYRDTVYVQFPQSDEWRMIPLVAEGRGMRISLTLPPGITHIDQAPYYGYGIAINYLQAQAAHGGVIFDSIGSSEEGRDIPLLLLDDPDCAAVKIDVMYLARNHAYESAGSFCAEGMIDFLLSDEALAQYFRHHYRFHFLPMTNPDGVFNGMSRLTAPQGADLNRSIRQNDSAWIALKNYIDQVKPPLFLNIHHWQDKVKDGLLANTEALSKNFRRLLPDLHEDGHHWVEQWTELYLRDNFLSVCPENHKSWKDYVRENFGSHALTLEFPWFNRTPQRMREIGQKALIAFLMTEKY